MRHRIDPCRPMTRQVRELGFSEPLPYQQAILYRFFGDDGALLYVGVTKRPAERWAAHRRTAHWWPMVAFVTFETHAHERATLNAEVAAIRAELPLFNTRSATEPRRDSSCAAHAPLTRYSEVTTPRVGGGVGGRGGVGEACISSYRREPRPVDNATATSTPTATDAWALRAGVGGV